MKNTINKEHLKILLAIDGSEQSLITVRYIGRVISKQAQMVLFRVMGEAPEAFRDMNIDPSASKVEYPLYVWKVHQKEIVNEFITKAREILVDSGMAQDAVAVKTKTITAGIARDIINESYQDYTALVIGRTGVSKIEEITMGSVATKLVEVVSHIPLIVVGERPESNKILIALDGSKGSMKAVKCAGTLLDPAVCEIMLCHVIRPLSIQQLSAQELFIQKYEKDWIEFNKRKIVPAIMEAKKRLMDAGFSKDHISSEILTYAQSRAAAIAKAARTGYYDTVVLGRRGFSTVGDFKIGRVSKKILQFAYQPALWVVN
jgi:nucleotide-binding universal stress UspA family protein